MPNTEAIGLLIKIMEDREKEGPFRNSTTHYYLIRVLHCGFILPTLVDDYLRVRSIKIFANLYPLARDMRMSLRRISENGGLPLKYSFLNETLLEQIDILEIMMLNSDDEEIPLDKFRMLNSFILSKTEEILSSLGEVTLEPAGTDYDQEVIDWWKNR